MIAHQLVDRVQPQWRELDGREPRVRRDLVEDAAAVVRADETARQHNRYWQLVESMQEIQHELERRRVTPMQVVDRDERCRRLRGARDQREQPV